MSETPMDDDMLPEYDFSKGKRGVYAERFRQAGVRQLDVDLRDVFPTSDAVNAALRSLIQAGRAETPDEMKKAS